MNKGSTPDSRLAALARKHFGRDNDLPTDANHHPNGYSMTLGQVLEDPQLGENAILAFWRLGKKRHTEQAP